MVRKIKSEHESSEIIKPNLTKSDISAFFSARMIEIVPKQIEEEPKDWSQESGVQLRIGKMEISLTSGFDREVLQSNRGENGYSSVSEQ